MEKGLLFKSHYRVNLSFLERLHFTLDVRTYRVHVYSHDQMSVICMNFIFSMWLNASECNSKIDYFPPWGFLWLGGTSILLFFLLQFGVRRERYMSSKGFKCINKQMNIVPFGEIVVCSSFCFLYSWWSLSSNFKNLFPTLVESKATYFSSWNKLIKSWFPFGKKIPKILRDIC